MSKEYEIPKVVEEALDLHIEKMEKDKQLTSKDLDPNRDPGYPPSYYDQQLMNHLLDMQKDFSSVLDSSLTAATLQGEQIKALNALKNITDTLTKETLSVLSRLEALEAKLNQ